jgi:hypothetical protein
MSEENESTDGGMSAIKKAIIGAITTAVTAGGAWFATHLGGEEPKEETKTEQAAPAAAPVINLKSGEQQHQPAEAISRWNYNHHQRKNCRESTSRV